MKKFLTPFFLVTLFAALASGCSSNSVMVGLKVELTSIVHPSAGAPQVSWRVVNPNVVSYLVAQANHRIFLNGVLVGTINDREAVAVPAQSNANRVSPLVSGGPAAERTLAAAATAGSAAYRLESVVTIRLYGDSMDKSSLSSAGMVPVTTK